MQKSTDSLIRLIKHSGSPYHTVQEIADILKENGFKEKKINEIDKAVSGESFFVNIYGRSIAAFRLPEKKIESFHIATSHTDNPCYVIKPNAERMRSGCLTLNVEEYGVTIRNTWMDRPLTIAGKVCVESDDPFTPDEYLFSSEKPVAIIPNLAIHMNREINRGVELKVQTDMEPVISLLTDGESNENALMDYVADRLNVESKKILDYELFLCNADEPLLTGLHDEFLSSPRLDNLTSCSSCLYGIINSQTSESICNVSVFFDNEECGSRSKQGAASQFLAMILEDINKAAGNNENFSSVICSSMTLSLDVAHATHPNHPEKHDPTNTISMADGVILKMNYNQKYATDSRALSVVEGLCRKNNITYRRFVNNSDVTGGGTLGSIISTSIPAMTADIGVPILAMHSSRELMAVSSQHEMDRFVESFFSR